MIVVWFHEIDINREKEINNIRKIREEHQKVLKGHSINLPYNTSVKNNQSTTENRSNNKSISSNIPKQHEMIRQ